MAEVGSHQPLLEPEEGRQRDIALDVKRGASCALAAGTTATTDQESQKNRNKLIFALIICFLFMIVEVVGGVFANSLAVMTDAAHLLSDVSGFGVALFANYVAAQSSINTHTFGYHRIEVLGALASVLSTWLVTGILLWEAVNRIIHPVDVNGKLMFLLALIGVAVNLLNFFVLGHHGHSHGGGDHDHNHAHGHRHSHSHSHGRSNSHSHSHDAHSHEHQEASRNINLHGAVLHVIGDLVQSLGVAVAGALIWWKQDDPRWHLADPICTFLFAFLVLLTTRILLRDVSDILMERVPRGQDADKIEEGLKQIEGVEEVHDLHVWALTPGIPLLAVHLNLSPGADGVQVLHQSTEYCRTLGIDHTTIQLIQDGVECCGQNVSGSGCVTRVPRNGAEGSAHDHAHEDGEHSHHHSGHHH